MNTDRGQDPLRSSVPIQFALLALLCLIAYAPFSRLPLIEDDYPSLAQAQVYGSFSQMPDLLHNTVFRVRATSVWSMHYLWNAFQLNPAAYHAASLILHILNTCLVFAIGLAWPRMRAAAWWAAAFFAVQEGHQEAVAWFTAINELWMFLFGAAALLCWMISITCGGRWYLDAAGVLFFGFSLISKESAVIFLPLFLLVAPRAYWRRLWPYAALALIVAASIVAGRDSSFRFSDGSFSLHAPFWITWPRGIARVLWFWGWVGTIAVWFAGDRERRQSALIALAWIGIALVPYSFLTYSTQIPSRQTYLASAGLAWLFGLGIDALWVKEARYRTAASILVLLMLAHNVGYLWTKKHAQFVKRAEPTEAIIRLARETEGPIWVQCFPRTDWIAKEAVHLGAGRPESILIWSAAEAERRKPSAIFCYKER
jgi:hypothetical protein